MAHYTDEEIRAMIIARKKAEKANAMNRDMLATLFGFAVLFASVYLFSIAGYICGIN